MSSFDKLADRPPPRTCVFSWSQADQAWARWRPSRTPLTPDVPALLLPASLAGHLFRDALATAPEGQMSCPGAVCVRPGDIDDRLEMLYDFRASSRFVSHATQQSDPRLQVFLAAHASPMELTAWSAVAGPHVLAVAFTIGSIPHIDAVVQRAGTDAALRALALGASDSIRRKVMRSPSFDVSSLSRISDLALAAGHPGMSARQQLNLAYHVAANNDVLAGRALASSPHTSPAAQKVLRDAGYGPEQLASSSGDRPMIEASLPKAARSLAARWTAAWSTSLDPVVQAQHVADRVALEGDPLAQLLDLPEAAVTAQEVADKASRVAATFPPGRVPDPLRPFSS